MSFHIATVAWQRHDAIYRDHKYSRAHRWSFDGGAEVPASSSPLVVREPFSDPTCVDPEEAFVAALSSCHMLWFLDLAARRGYVVDAYTDTAQGLMAADADGKQAITTVWLRPVVVISGQLEGDDASLAALHHEAHESCFLARSVKTDIVIDGSWQRAQE